MVDPDAPSPDDPAYAEWLHWVVDDIPNGAKNVASLRPASARAETLAPAFTGCVRDLTAMHTQMHMQGHICVDANNAAEAKGSQSPAQLDRGRKALSV